MSPVFVTGISTEVGKTLAAAILVEALQADYWKPVQAGDLEHSDSHKIQALISNNKSVIHPNAYALQTPMSPHAAAEIDGVRIEGKHIQPPKTANQLVIEGAGGLLVPLNNTETILDLIRPEYRVVVVSRHYLGSINHTLLTVGALRERGYDPAILFNGEEHPSTEAIIRTRTKCAVLGRMGPMDPVNPDAILREANRLRPALTAWLS